MILKCCRHSDGRHIVDAEDGSVICLTGFCRCGLPKIRKRVQASTKNQAAKVYGRAYKLSPEVEE